MFVLFYDDCWKICTVWDKFDWTQILQLYKTRSLLAQVFLLWSKTRKREMYRVIGKSIVSENNVVVVDSQIITSFAEKYLAGHRSKPEDGPVNFFRSRSDKFDYKLLQLPSGLRILLISDPSGDELDPHLSCPFESILTRSSKMDKSRSSKSKKSQKSFKSNKSGRPEKIASLSIGVSIGSFHDPANAQGLAHLLEHLMFMGSEEFPGESQLDDYLSPRGGFTNAQTDPEYTCYELMVLRPFLKKTINMLGAAFASPLLRKESAEKEIRPIDSEFSEACNDDDVRIELLMAHVANPDHPLSLFLWGNTKSLFTEPAATGTDIHKLVRDFYLRYYTPENIVVIVQSQETLENLQDWTVSAFSKVQSKAHLVTAPPNNKIANGLPFDPVSRTFHKVYYVESIASGVRLRLNWCFESTVDKFLQTPLEYIAYLFGDETKGSLFSELRKRNFVTELNVHCGNLGLMCNRLHNIFSLCIELTATGEKNLDTIVALIFEYIAAIRKIGAQEYYFREHQQIALNNFNSRSEKNPFDNTVDLVKNLLYFPPELILTAEKLFYTFDKTLIDNFLNDFVPEKTNFILHGFAFDGSQPILSEPKVGTRYQVKSVPESWTQVPKLVDSTLFHYPFPNEFIAKKFDLLADTLPANAPERKQGNYPQRIYKTNRMSVWHKCDFNFKLPKAAIFILVMSPHFFESHENSALSDVVFKYLIFSLKEDTYAATTAHLNSELKLKRDGILLKLNGFNHKLSQLAMLVLKGFAALQFDDETIESIKKVTTDCYDDDYQDPHTLNKYMRYELMLNDFSSVLDRLPFVKKANKAQLENFMKTVLSNISFEILVQGNLSIDETLQLAESIETIFDLKAQTGEPYRKHRPRVYQMPIGEKTIRYLTPNDSNLVSYVVYHQQLGAFTVKSYCYLVMMVDMINNLCFQMLRTKEGLGYRVGYSNSMVYGILGMMVYVVAEADRFDCTFVVNRIRKFMAEECRDYIATLSEKAFQKHLTSIIKTKELPPLSLREEMERNWKEVMAFEYCFDRAQRQIKFYKKATLQDFQEWFATTVLSNQSRVVNFEVVGNGKIALDECLTKDSKPVASDMITNKMFELIRNPPYLVSNRCVKENFITDVKSFQATLQTIVATLDEWEH